MQSTNTLVMFTIYHNPSDYPGKFVARRCTILPGAVAMDDEPLAVADTLEAAREAIPTRALVCMARSAAERPIPGTKVIPCSGCQRPVMISPAGVLHPVAREPTTRFLCFECARPHFPEITEIVEPTAEQWRELESAGVDPNNPLLLSLWGKR